MNNKKSWLVIFTDLMAIILTLFVLIFAMSNIDNKKWNDIHKSLSKNLNPKKQNIIQVTDSNPQPMTEVDSLMSLDYLSSIIKNKLKNNDDLSVDYTNDKIVISLNKDTLVENKNDAIQVVADVLYIIPNHIDIYSYVAKNDDNNKWEDALQKAFVIAKKLKDKGYNYQITPIARSSENINSDINIVIRNYNAQPL